MDLSYEDVQKILKIIVRKAVFSALTPLVALTSLAASNIATAPFVATAGQTLRGRARRHLMAPVAERTMSNGDPRR